MNIKVYIDDLNMRLKEISDINQQKDYWVDNIDPNISTSYDELFNDLYPLLSSVDSFPFTSIFKQECKALLTMLDLYKEPMEYFSKGDLSIIEDVNWVEIVDFSKKLYSLFREEKIVKDMRVL